MIEINDLNGLPDLKNNAILGEFKLINSKIRIYGNNNILYLNNTVVNNTTINIRGDDSILFACNTRISNFQPFIINPNTSCVIFDGLTSGRTSLNIGDGNLIIGQDCMLADEIFIQTHDGHSIYSQDSHQLINPGHSIILGDHVWLGRRVNVIKGAQIGSGSMIGVNSVCNKSFPCNSCIAGSPAKVIKNNIFWIRQGRHTLDFNKRQNHLNYYNSDEYVYDSTDFNKYILLDTKLSSEKSAKEKFKILQCFVGDHV